jgi:hypothetical protein
LVKAHDAAPGVEYEDDDLRGFDQAFGKIAFMPKRFLRPLSFGDVREGDDTA